MRILFLDIDGVLNSLDNMEANYFLWKNKPKHKSKDRFGDLFDQRCVNWLNYIILKTDCKIIISSTWKLNGLDALNEMWEERELPSIIVDATPNIENAIRGEEIEAWLKYNKGFDLESYCIVDDNDDMLEGQPLVQTNPRFGLTKEEAVKIIQILNK